MTLRQRLRIDEIRREKGIKMSDIASSMGIQVASLSQTLSRDSCSIKTLDSIAKALGVKLVELFKQ